MRATMWKFMACVVLTLSVSGCAMTPGEVRGVANDEVTKAGVIVADRVANTLLPGLVNVQGGLDGVKQGLNDLEAKRESEGSEKGAPLDPMDWLGYVGLPGVLGLFGVNALRDKKYKKVPVAT